MPTTQLRLVTPTRRPPVRERVPDEQVINLTVTADERLLLTVVEAARRLGIGRSFMYELIAAGQIETIHIGRLCKVSVDALAAFVERQRAPREGA
jgi:excisionase family DNA binding protein